MYVIDSTTGYPPLIYILLPIDLPRRTILWLLLPLYVPLLLFLSLLSVKRYTVLSLYFVLVRLLLLYYLFIIDVARHFVIIREAYPEYSLRIVIIPPFNIIRVIPFVD